MEKTIAQWRFLADLAWSRGVVVDAQKMTAEERSEKITELQSIDEATGLDIDFVNLDEQIEKIETELGKWTFQ